MILPTDAAARKRLPIFSGVIAYFPRALAQVANVSREGNEQHHPGAPLHWDKSKSTDQLDALVRHLVDALDPACDPIHALAQVAWRALAELEMRLTPTAPHTRPGCAVLTMGKTLPNSGNAFAAAIADGAGDYGNPVTPHCATPWRLP